MTLDAVKKELTLIGDCSQDRGFTVLLFVSMFKEGYI